ncbi:PorP/SprF family type IX secretion system membrane protein [Tenuifilum thalassicum]|uniref:Type IX secretion system membrane protein PorP/SprF n=1 Tax=Tenuifilum thalassicum TaxID=2590900 RepID=A0A7D4BT80_9BACT|nr:type IX secretion system membrane protein PorP/SprF [Tenuifilum thalassicum]QKG80981.1 type IX secretion system membrane protein PorP/SprF [Tenuifilum thalassicum]
MKTLSTAILQKFTIVGIILCLLTPSTTVAQEIPQYTQFMFNPYLFNPAIAGTLNHYQVRANNRNQWVGINDAPFSVSASIYGPFTKYDMGWGAYITNDVTGPTAKTNFMGTYAYNMMLTDDIRVSGGISFGMMLYRLDGTKLKLGEEADPVYDPAIINSTKTLVTPDASIGFYLYSTSFNVGLSAHQLFGQRLKFYPKPIEPNRLKQHIMLSGGYWLSLNRNMEIETSLLLKYMFGNPMQVEVNGKFTYLQKDYNVWSGLSVRYKDAIAIMVGFTWQKKYMIGYSFDWSLLGIRKYNSGSHEVMFGYNFDKLK